MHSATEEQKNTARENGLRFLNKTLNLLLGHSEVKITYQTGESTTIYHIECQQKDLSRLLGNKGSTIASLRRLVNVITYADDVRSIIEVPYFPIEKKKESDL